MYPSKVRYSRKIVAFIDILGFREHVLDPTKCEEIATILNMPNFLSQESLTSFLKLKGIRMTTISDSIVVSIDVSMNGAMNKLFKILSVLTEVLLADYGILIRGGISIGDLYHDSDIVFGPALVEAYKLENEIAIYPRIIIKRSDLEESVLSSGDASQKILLNQEFIQDFDGMHYLDAFSYSDSMRINECLSVLKTKISDNEKINQKINWLEIKLKEKIEEVID